MPCEKAQAWDAFSNAFDHFRGEVDDINTSEEIVLRRVVKRSRIQLETFSPEFPYWARLETLFSNMSDRSLQLTFLLLSDRMISQLHAAAMSVRLKNVSEEKKRLLLHLNLAGG